MRSFAETILRYRLSVLVLWLALVAVAGVFAAQLSRVLTGGAEPILGSPSQQVNDMIEKYFGSRSLYQYLVIVESDEQSIYHPEFRNVAQRVADALTSVEELREVRTYWNFGLPDLKGDDDASTLMLVPPDVATHHEAEKLTPALREAIRSAELPPSYSAHVTSMSAMFHDLDVNSSSDLLAAERIGLPITLIILLAVFGAPVAAALPVLLALAAVIISLAALFFLSRIVPVS
ncbi:MAG: MMPL family transporter, partial [Candidatus Binatia bacterium]